MKILDFSNSIKSGVGVCVCEHLAQRIAAEAFAFEYQRTFRKTGYHSRRAGVRGALVGCLLELDWSTLRVHDRVNFGREPDSGSAHTPISTPGFAVEPCS